MNSSPALAQVIFCGVYWLLLFVVYFYKVNIRLLRDDANRSGIAVFGLLVLLYSIFEFSGGDFYNYKLLYDNYAIFGTTSHLEPIYETFIDLSPNYYIWRLIVWGIAVSIWILVVKFLKLDSAFSSLMFILIVFFHFVGARQSIGFATIFLGLSFITDNSNKRFWHILVGCFLLLISILFHKTMIIYILIILVSMIPIRKRVIAVSLCVFPIVYMYFDTFIVSFLQYLGNYAEDTSNVFQRYLDSDFRSDANIFGTLRLIIERTPVLIAVLYSMYKVFFVENRQPYIYEVLLRASYIMIYISFLFIGREVSAFISPRFWDASLFPVTIFLSYYFFKIRRTSIVKVLVLMFLAAKLFLVLYNIYKFA